ncbi:hypothetical protein GCM10027200_43440 [Lentzea nigeriaca]
MSSHSDNELPSARSAHMWIKPTVTSRGLACHRVRETYVTLTWGTKEGAGALTSDTNSLRRPQG